MRRIRISTGTASIARGVGNVIIRRMVSPQYQQDARELLDGAAGALTDGVALELQIGKPRRRLKGRKE